MDILRWPFRGISLIIQLPSHRDIWTGGCEVSRAGCEINQRHKVTPEFTKLQLSDTGVHWKCRKTTTRNYCAHLMHRYTSKLYPTNNPIHFNLSFTSHHLMSNDNSSSKSQKESLMVVGCEELRTYVEQQMAISFFVDHVLEFISS